MQAEVQSPLRVYLDHLERGELAYQFSLAAGRPVFFPRVLCPFTGSDQLEWRGRAGVGAGLGTTVGGPAEGAPYHFAFICCCEGLPMIRWGRGGASPNVPIGKQPLFCFPSSALGR